MSIEEFILAFCVTIVILFTGYVFLRKDKYGAVFQIGGYIMLGIIGLSIVVQGLSLPTGTQTMYENQTTNEMTVIQETTNDHGMNWTVGVSLIVLSMLGLFKGIQRFSDDEEEDELF